MIEKILDSSAFQQTCKEQILWRIMSVFDQKVLLTSYFSRTFSGASETIDHASGTVAFDTRHPNTLKLECCLLSVY